MKKRALKASLIVFEVVAICLAVVAAGGAFLYWKLEQGPVSLSLLKPSLELAVSSQIPKQYSAEIDQIELTRDGGDFVVHLNGLQITDPDQGEVASATDMVLHFHISALFSGEIGPTTIDVEGAKFRIIRNVEQRIKIPATKRRKPSRMRKSLKPLFNGRILKSAFQSAEIDHAVITFSDVASGRSWVSRDAMVSIARTDMGLKANVAGKIDQDNSVGNSSSFIEADAHYKEDDGIISANIKGVDFPVGDILSTFYGDRAAIIDAPVTGNAVISFTTEGAVLSSQFAAHISTGDLLIGAERQAIEVIQWDTSFDPAKNEFEINEFFFDVGGSRGDIRGGVKVGFDDDIRSLKNIAFDLVGTDLLANIPGKLPQALPIASASVVGDYLVADSKLSLSDISLSLLDVSVAGNFDIARMSAGEGEKVLSPAINADIRFDGSLDPNELLQIWPYGVAMGARDWIEDRVEAADIHNIHAVVNMPAGAVGDDGLIPDEMIDVSFDAKDVKAYFIKRMTPVTRASGHGVLRGNSFQLKVQRARVGEISILAGEVEYPTFIPKWEPTYIRLTAVGRSEVILDLLDQEPLRLLSKIDLGPEQFAGDARVNFEVMRPNKRDVPAEDYRYSGRATFDHMEITGLFGDLVFHDGKGVVDLKPRSMVVTADAQLSDAPIHIVWDRNFFQQDGPSSLKGSGVINSSTGDLFGISSRQFLRGPVAFDAQAIGDLGDFDSITIDADFSEAALTLDALGWRKAMGAPAKGTLQVELSPEETITSNLSLEGDGISIAGKISFDENEALDRLHLPRLYLENAADLSVLARRGDAGEFVVNAVGEYINAGPMITAFIDGGADNTTGDVMGWGAGITVSSRIDRISMREGVEYRVASLDLWRDANRLLDLDFTAFGNDDTPLSVNMALTGEAAGPQQTITAQTGSIGTFLRGVFGLTSIEGGTGEVLVNLAGAEGKGLSGKIEAHDIRVVEAPLLARIFAAGSLVGLVDLLNGEGIDLSNAYGEFDFSDNVLTLENTRATGPSVGITANGQVAINDGGEITLNGAVAPIYMLNSLLGNAPIIGDLFVGKKGEGMFALSYKVTGERAAPTVLVNPLSALTPGIFRRLFDPQQSDEADMPMETDDLEMPKEDQKQD